MGMVEDFRKKVRKQIIKLPREKQIHLAWLWAVRALPFLGTVNKFTYWDNDKRFYHLYSVFNALDISKKSTKYTRVTDDDDGAYAARTAAIRAGSLTLPKRKNFNEASKKAIFFVKI
jgi:hypothetical protein